MFAKVEIPYGAYWSTPFSRWQKSLSHLHAIKFAAHIAKAELAKRAIPVDVFDHGVLGFTVPQRQSFWGLPWFMSLIGNGQVPGHVVSQACATSVRALLSSALEVELGAAEASLCVTCDRTSNSPFVVYPRPTGMGGGPEHENWMTDNFNDDPMAHVAMVDTAENCAREWQIDTLAQHDLVLRRTEQYCDALAHDSAFQKRYMTLPLAIPDEGFGKTVGTLSADEGIHPTTAEGLSKLKPLRPGGTVTFGGQTHPADGNAAIVVTNAARARTLSRDPKIRVRILSVGQGRERPAFMPAAPVKAARQALDRAGIEIADLAAIKSHNPFVVNDIVFARETGADLAKMNNFGCSLIYGHPQGPTGMRLIIELIEELALRGGGYGLFHGCAAGDSAMAVVVKVEDAAKSG